MLKRLWSPTNLLVKDITFKPGLNLIIGKYADKKETQGINGIGKSSIIRLIDYALCSESAEKNFNHAKYSFLKKEKHQICLDLEINGVVLQLSREFSDNKRIHIKKNNEQHITYDLTEAKTVLGDLFFPNTLDRQLPGKNFRSLMPFFVKDDLKNYKRDSPIEFIVHGGTTQESLTILNLFLLGLPNNSLINLQAKKTNIKELSSKESIIKNQIEKYTGKKIAELRTELSYQKKDLEILKESLQEFKLIDNFKDISNAINELTQKIALKQKEEGNLSRQLDKLKRFVAVKHEVEIDSIAEQYNLVSQALGALIRRQLEEVIQFRTSLADERLRFHGRSMQQLEESKIEVIKEITKLDAKRSALLKSLDSDTNGSLTTAFQKLAEQSTKVERIDQALADLDDIKNSRTDTELECDTARNNAIHAIKNAQYIINDIQELFFKIVNIINDSSNGAYLDIDSSPRKRNQSPIKIEIEIPRNDALGKARFKLIIYDLTVFFHSLDAKLSLPDFLVHDGVFHSISRRNVVKTLNYIYQCHLQNSSFQYIATFNEDELALAENERIRDGSFSFNLEENTIITLQDTEENMLFKRTFE